MMRTIVAIAALSALIAKSDAFAPSIGTYD
jgi:hypothetical protein